MPTLLSRMRPGRQTGVARCSLRSACGLLIAVLLLAAHASPWTAARAPAASSLARAEVPASSTSTDHGKLFDAVAERTAKDFWDKERLATVGWEKRAMLHDAAGCIGCSQCAVVCPFDAIRMERAPVSPSSG